MMRVFFLLLVAFTALGPPAAAHPLGLPPYAEITAEDEVIRTSLFLALDDTFILVRQAGGNASVLNDDGPDAFATQHRVATYLTERYRLISDGEACDGRVTGGETVAGGFRFRLTHRCPEVPGETVVVRNGILRDVSSQYRLVVGVKAQGITRRWNIEPGQNEAKVELRGFAGSESGEREEPLEGLARLFTFLDEGSGVAAAAAALAIAAGLGALHGLGPGHGKTLVAAYLAGSDAKLRHAFAVGAAMTVTHTAGVFILGILALAAGAAFVPQRVEPVLRVVAAAVVLALGLWLVVSRARALKRGTADDAHHHVHRHGRGLWAVGAAGGLVPCPEAFGLLFVALSVGRVGAGLLLLVAFSLGLAAVLVAVAAALVVSRRVAAPRLERSRVLKFMPLVSALTVTAIGAALAVGAVRGF